MPAISMNDFPERIPAPPDLVEQASSLARQFSANCFWFWHPEASVRYLDDVRLVVHHLREYGGWKEWKAAQNLQQCLSQHSNARS